MKEIWKDVIGYEGYYQVSNLANVRSIDREISHKRHGKIKLNGVLLKQSLSGYIGGQYYSVNLHKNHVGKTTKAHRLVALAFITNHENKKEVNHIDGNKLNNNLNNLEWCTASENIQHSYDIGLKKKVYGNDNNLAKAVINIETGIYYESLKEASFTCNIKYNSLKSYVNGNRKNISKFQYV